MKINPCFAIVSLMIMLFTACKKDSGGPKSLGNFTATINNTSWEAHRFKCHYYPQFNELFIFAFDKNSNYGIEMVVIIDSTAAEKKYNFQANGSHSATFYDRCDYTYFTDVNLNSITGSIDISKLDTVAKKASARFSFKAYSKGKNDFVTVSAGHLEEIEMVVINEGSVLYAPWRGSYLEATINDTTHWYVPYQVSHTHMQGMINVFTSREELRGSEYSRSCTSDDYAYRDLSFVIPIDKGVGTFPLLPLPPQTWYSDKHLCNYSARNEDDDLYQPVSGSITITQMDIAQRKFRATFNIELKNAANNTIKITNGKLIVEKLYE